MSEPCQMEAKVPERANRPDPFCCTTPARCLLAAATRKPSHPNAKGDVNEAP